MAFNQGCKGFIPHNCILTEYLYYSLKAKISYFQQIGTGTTFKEISAEKIKDTLIPLPPLAEQGRIAQLLDQATDLVKSRKMQLQTLDELAQSTFYSLFGDPISNPKGWQVKTLGEVGEIVGGGTPSTGDPEMWNDDNLWITPAEMGKRFSPYVDDTLRKVSNAGLKYTSGLMPTHSVIMSCRAPIGHLVINTRPMAFNQGCKGFILYNCILTEYLYYSLKAKISYFQQIGTGTTFKEISAKKIKDTSIPLPPLSLQQQFAEIVGQIEAAKACVRRGIQETEDLLGALMQGVFAPLELAEEHKHGIVYPDKR